MVDKRKKLINEFGSMRNLVELKALSKISLTRPLTEWEYDQMFTLKDKLLKGGIENGIFPNS